MLVVIIISGYTILYKHGISITGISNNSISSTSTSDTCILNNHGISKSSILNHELSVYNHGISYSISNHPEGMIIYTILTY